MFSYLPGGSPLGLSLSPLTRGLVNGTIANVGLVDLEESL